jgi:hypothetical protein
MQNVFLAKIDTKFLLGLNFGSEFNLQRWNEWCKEHQGEHIRIERPSLSVRSHKTLSTGYGFLMEACMFDPGTVGAIAFLISAITALLAELRKWRR